MARIVDNGKLTRIISGLVIARQADNEDLDVLAEWQVNSLVLDRLLACYKALEEVIQEARLRNGGE